MFLEKMYFAPSTYKEKIREERIFQIVHCPFEGLDSLMGWSDSASLVATRKVNVGFQKFFFPCFYTHS